MPVVAASGGLVVALALFACGGADPSPGVYSSPDAVQPLAVGEAVPSVTVRDVEGEPVDLAELVRDAGALLVFYRGGW